MSKNDIAKKIKDTLIMRAEEIDEQIVEGLKDYIRLTEDGKIIFVFDRSTIRISDQILLYLTGKKLANMASLTDSDKATPEEIAEVLAIPKGTAAPRLMELIQSGKVIKVERGVYEATTFGILDLVFRLPKKPVQIEEEKQ